MGLFSNNSNNGTVELYKQKAHLSNDYLQRLTPLIETMNENESKRHDISRQLVQLVEEMQESLSPEMFTKAVGFVETFVGYSKDPTESYNTIKLYWTKIGEKTKELSDQYGGIKAI